MTNWSLPFFLVSTTLWMSRCILFVVLSRHKILLTVHQIGTFLFNINCSKHVKTKEAPHHPINLIQYLRLGLHLHRRFVTVGLWINSAKLRHFPEMVRSGTHPVSMLSWQPMDKKRHFQKVDQKISGINHCLDHWLLHPDLVNCN